MSAKPNEQYRAFEDLTKRLMAVPKGELDKKMNEYEKRKVARKKTANLRRRSKP
jgi:hypothetical protein